MNHHLDIYQETKPTPKLPRTIAWPMAIVAFPFVLVTSIIWLPVLLLRKPVAPEPLPNKTPCGKMCVHSYWKIDDWRCAANQGYTTTTARRSFTTKKDPNNCTMFKKIQNMMKRDNKESMETNV